jgi:type IV pilus assembly protein PilQ
MAGVFRSRFLGRWLSVAVVILCGVFTADGQQEYDSTSLQTSGSAPSRRIIESFEVTNANVRAVFKQLSDYSGVDIVLSQKVGGSISMTVTNKNWVDIISIICKVRNLVAHREQNYIYVMTEEEYQKNKVESANTLQIAEKLSPLQREIITLKNTTVEELKPSLESMLSERGKIDVVQHNNSLIVYDTEANIGQIKTMVKNLDIETAQISISCKIIEVSAGIIQSMGIHWGFFDEQMSVNASHLDQTSIIPGALERLSYGILSPQRFSVALEYLFTDDKGEVVAQPQITTLDNKEARIFMGSQVPARYFDDAGNTVIKMIDAGTELTVTPHVTGDNRIRLKLNPKKKDYQFQEGLPIISEQSAATNVVVNDGETVVIAGLTSNESRNSEGGIPFLKDIPLLGNLFKRSRKSTDKSDLIIFVTPHIVQKKMDAITGTESNSE